MAHPEMTGRGSGGSGRSVTATGLSMAQRRRGARPTAHVRRRSRALRMIRLITNTQAGNSSTIHCISDRLSSITSAMT